MRLPGAQQHILPIIEHGYRNRTDYITVHDMEADNIDAVEAYFKGGATPDHVGAHVGIGHGKTYQWADLNALVYHAIGGNSESVGIECCGYASFTRWRWLHRRRFRRDLAKAIAHICHLYDLGQPTHLGGKGNVRGHADVSRQNHVAGGHTDPGPNFPWVTEMRLARKYYKRWYG